MNHIVAWAFNPASNDPRAMTFTFAAYCLLPSAYCFLTAATASNINRALASGVLPSNTALPVTIKSAPVAAICAILSLVIPPSTPRMMFLPDAAIIF